MGAVQLIFPAERMPKVRPDPDTLSTIFIMIVPTVWIMAPAAMALSGSARGDYRADPAAIVQVSLFTIVPEIVQRLCTITVGRTKR